MMALFNNTETSSNIRLQYQMCSKKTPLHTFIGLFLRAPLQRRNVYRTSDVQRSILRFWEAHRLWGSG